MLFGCGCCGLILPSCSTVPITERRQLSIIPEATINRQSSKAYENFRAKTKLVKSGKDLDKIIEIGSTDVDINSHAKLEFENGFISEVNASFTQNLGTETIINGRDGIMRIMNPWQAVPPIICLEGKVNKKIENRCINNIFSYEINAISKNILEKKFSPDFPGLSIKEIIGGMKILDKWLN